MFISFLPLNRFRIYSKRSLVAKLIRSNSQAVWELYLIRAIATHYSETERYRAYILISQSSDFNGSITCETKQPYRIHVGILPFFQPSFCGIENSLHCLKFDGEQLKPHKLCIHHRIGTDEDDVIAPLSVIQSPILHLIIISSIYSYHFKLEIDVDWWWRRIPSLNQHLDINTHIRLEIILDFSLCERFKRPILFLFTVNFIYLFNQGAHSTFILNSYSLFDCFFERITVDKMNT